MDTVTVIDSLHSIHPISESIKSSIDLYQIILSILTGIISSIVFLVIIFILRPRLKISHEICRRFDEKTGRNVYMIKVINKSRWFKVIDVNAELISQEPVAAPVLTKTKNCNGATNLKLKRLKLKEENGHIWFINRRKYSCKHASFAYIFTCIEDLDTLWDENKKQTLHFKIISKHGLSGFPKLTTMEYADKNSCIKEGRFYFGNTCEIAN